MQEEKMKPRVCILAILVLAASMFAGPSIASARPQPAEDLLIADVPFRLNYCFRDFTDKLRFDLGVWHEVEQEFAEPSFDFDVSDQGKTRWFEGLDPENMNALAIVMARLTNGIPNLMFVGVANSYTGQGAGIANRYEKVFFGDELRPKQVDLKGYQLKRIGVRFNAVYIYNISTGSCYNVDTTVLFTQAATKAACKNGGWKVFERMDGTAFVTEKACVVYVVTGQ
jgi:hypothetical protein